MEMTVQKQQSSATLGVAVALVPLLVLVSIGALNGGVAPTTGVWTTLATFLRGMLQSDLVIALAIIALLGGIWQATHGRGYSFLMTVLSILAVGFMGPGIITTIATSTRPAAEVQQLQLVKANITKPAPASHQPRL